MGIVYRGLDRELGRRVAIKLLPAELSRQPGFGERFKREAQAAAALSHGCIATMYDIGQDRSGPYLVMEYVEGTPLNTLAAAGRLSPGQITGIVADVLDALAHSHGRGVIHRDVKPSNVIVDHDRAKVLDFGIAKIVADSVTRLTATGAAIGTPAYMAPEQAAGGDVDRRADVYAVGCLLYELLTGRPPFTADSAMAVLLQHINSDPLPPSARCPELPRAWDAVVLRALAKRPADRFAGASEMRAAVLAAAAPPPARRPSTFVLFGRRPTPLIRLSRVRSVRRPDWLVRRLPRGRPLKSYARLTLTAMLPVFLGSSSVAIQPQTALARRPPATPSASPQVPDQSAAVLTGFPDTVDGVAFHRGGRMLATVSGREVQLWDVAARSRIGGPLFVHTGWLTKVVFSPDGRTLAVAGAGRKVWMFDIGLRSRRGRVMDGDDMAFSADSRTIALADRNKIVMLDTVTQDGRGELVAEQGATFLRVAFSPDRRTLATSEAKRRKTTAAKTFTVVSAALPGSMCLKGFQFQHTVRVWNIAGRSRLGGPLISAVPCYGPYEIDYAPGGKTLSIRIDTALLWSLSPRREVAVIKGIDNLAYGPSIVTSQGKELQLWDPDGTESGGPLTGHTDDINSVAFSPDGHTIASAGDDRTVRLWTV